MTETISKYKRIAFVSNSAWSVLNFRKDVILHLIQLGYEVCVFAPEDENTAELLKIGCSCENIILDNKSSNPVKDLLFYVRLKRMYKKWKPQFVFHFVAKPNIYGTIAASSLNIPSVAVVTGLGYAFAQKNWLYWVVKKLYKFSLKKAVEVWFLNNEDATTFSIAKLVDIQKVKVLAGEGINTEYFKRSERVALMKDQPFEFLMSARLLKSKGIEVLADASRILKKKNHQFVCRLIGFSENHHPDSISLESLQKWQQEGLLIYSGYAKDVRTFLENADCFVFPSFYNEGVPRSLMEAASMGLPIITTNAKGCREVVIQEQTGYTCLPNDPFDLADKMEKMLLLSESERLKMGETGRQWVAKKFEVSHTIREYENVLNNFRASLRTSFE